MMRKNHTESQLSIYAAEWQKTLKPEAKKRQKRKPKDSVPATVPEQKEDSRDVAADKFGIGGRTVSKAANVLEKSCKQLQQAKPRKPKPPVGP